jgi:hypothetical protein
VHAQLGHAGEAAAVHDHVVEGERVVDRVAVAGDARFQQRALLALERAGEQLRHDLLHVRERDVGDEAEPPVVDADQRRTVGRKLPPDAEHRAVAAEHDGDVRARADLGGLQRGVAGSADLVGGLSLEHHVEAELRDGLRERRQRLADTLRVAAAD